jgi:hypothetical protein
VKEGTTESQHEHPFLHSSEVEGDEQRGYGHRGNPSPPQYSEILEENETGKADSVLVFCLGEFFCDVIIRFT